MKKQLTDKQHEGRMELDHDPDPYELRCGHGPKHGCGRGKGTVDR